MWGDIIRFHTYCSEEQLVRDKKTVRRLYSPGEQGDTVNRSKQFSILAMDWVTVLLRWSAQAWQGYYINGELVLSCEQRNCCKGEKKDVSLRFMYMFEIFWNTSICRAEFGFWRGEKNSGFGEDKTFHWFPPLNLYLEYILFQCALFKLYPIIIVFACHEHTWRFKVGFVELVLIHPPLLGFRESSLAFRLPCQMLFPQSQPGNHLSSLPHQIAHFCSQATPKSTHQHDLPLSHCVASKSNLFNWLY